MSRMLSGRNNQRGQASIFITLTLLVTLGLLGLVVDIGWAYWRKQAAKAAAQSAAIGASVAKGAAAIGFTCGTSATCVTDQPCSATPSNPPVTIFDNGCL